MFVDAGFFEPALYGCGNFARNLLVLSFGPGPALNIQKQSDFLVGKPIKMSSCNKSHEIADK